MAADPRSLSDILRACLPGGLKKVALAVSGGSDSTALVRLAASLESSTHPTPQFVVLSVDHQLREGSEEDTSFVRELAESLGLEVHILQWRGTKPESGLQEAARQARYRLMIDKCRSLGVEVLVTAHTMDDQAETFLMRLKRGSGLDGLSAMSLCSELDGFAVLRPLLQVRRDALRDYLKDKGQHWIEDPSNQNPDFERVQIRKNSDHLEEMGLTAESLAQSAARLMRARQAIETQVQKTIADLVVWYDAGCCQISNEPFSQLSEEIAIRVLSHMLLAVGGGKREPQLKKIEHALTSWRHMKPGAGFTLAGCRVVLKKDKTIIVREMKRKSDMSDSSLQSMTLGTKTFWDRRFLCEISCPQPGENIAGEETGFVIKALGKEGWQMAKAQKSTADNMPSYIGRSLVSLWQGEQLLSVPHIGLTHETIKFDVLFMPRGVMSSPRLHTYLG